MFATEPKSDIVRAYLEAGGTGPRYAEVPLGWGPDEDEAAAAAHSMFRFGLTGWKVQSELPNPINFEAATDYITVDDVRKAVPCGPEADLHLSAVKSFVDAGFDRVTLMNAGPTVDDFFGFFSDELAEPIRGMSAG